MKPAPMLRGASMDPSRDEQGPGGEDQGKRPRDRGQETGLPVSSKTTANTDSFAWGKELEANVGIVSTARRRDHLARQAESRRGSRQTQSKGKSQGQRRKSDAPDGVTRDPGVVPTAGRRRLARRFGRSNRRPPRGHPGREDGDGHHAPAGEQAQPRQDAHQQAQRRQADISANTGAAGPRRDSPPQWIAKSQAEKRRSPRRSVRDQPQMNDGEQAAETIPLLPPIRPAEIPIWMSGRGPHDLSTWRQFGGASSTGIVLDPTRVNDTTAAHPPGSFMAGLVNPSHCAPPAPRRGSRTPSVMAGRRCVTEPPSEAPTLGLPFSPMMTVSEEARRRLPSPE